MNAIRYAYLPLGGSFTMEQTTRYATVAKCHQRMTSDITRDDSCRPDVSWEMTSPDSGASSPDLPAMSPDVPAMSPDVTTMSTDVFRCYPDVSRRHRDVSRFHRVMSPDVTVINSFHQGVAAGQELQRVPGPLNGQTPRL